MELADFKAVLGRITFAMGPLDFLRPFMGPLFTWSAAVGLRGRQRLPWSITFLLVLIKKGLAGEGRMVQVPSRVEDLGEAFRTDAKAQGQEVVIGGWETFGGCRSRTSRWFSVHLNRKNAPWAFARGEPFKTIAALELFGTLVAVMCFADGWPRNARSTMSISGATDNSGTPFALSRLMSSKFPLLVVLAELSEQLRARNLLLDLVWVPREQNVEADALTNSVFDGFDEMKRFNIKIESINWLVMDDMLVAADNIHHKIMALKEGEKFKKDARQPRKKSRKLRETDPWDAA